MTAQAQSIDKDLVLYVDDEKVNRTVFKQFSDEFTLKIVDSGAAALQVLETEPVAVLVTDQRMPEMTGVELLAKVKERFPAVIRIVLTAFPDMNPVVRAVNEQLAHRYIQKPFDEPKLRETLRWALASFRVARETALYQRVVESEKLITLGNLHGMMVHDLRAPVAYVRYSVQRLSQLEKGTRELSELLERHGNDLTSTARSQLDALAKELPELVKDMLTGTKQLSELLSQTEGLIQRPKKEPSRVSDPMPSIRFAVSYGKYQVHQVPRSQVYYDGPSALGQAAIGSTELLQVLLNLVGNAAYAIMDRRAPGGEIRVVAREVDAHLRLVVTDNGPGMNAETLRQLGTPFFSKRDNGSGLGIAQCHRLLEGAKGKLSFESTEGVGTSAIVTVPRV